MIDGPVRENGPAIYIFAGHGAKHARIVGADAMVAHDEVTVFGDANGAEVADVFVLRRNVRLRNRVTINIDDALTDFDLFSRQADDALDERLGAVERIPENDDVAALDGLEAINKFIDEDAFLVGEQRGHAGAFDFYGLIEKNDDDESEADGNEKIARPNTNFISQGMGRRGRRR